MNKSFRQLLIELLNSYQLGLRDKPLLALREHAERRRIGEATCRWHYQRLLLQPPRRAGESGSLPAPPTLQEWNAAAKPEAPVGALTEVDGAEFGMRVSDRVQHWAISGATGSGKSVTLRRLALALAAKVGLLVVDQKRDFTDFPTLLDAPCARFSTDAAIWFGLQAPAGVSDRDWAMVLAVILAARCGLKHATTSIARMLVWLVDHLNCGRAGARWWPDFQLLCDVAVAAPPGMFASKDDYERSAVQVLDGLAHALGPFARTFRGIDIEEDFLSKNISVVVDLSTLAPPARWVVIDVLLCQLLIGRLARDQKTDRADLCVIVDESDELVDDTANVNFPGGQSPLLRILRQGREFGIMAALGINAI